MQGLLPTFALLVMVGVAGCATGRIYGPESPYYTWPSGTRLILNRPLTVPAGSARIALQDGRAVPLRAAREYEAHCILLTGTVSDGSYRIEAGVFDVVGVSRTVDHLVARDSWPLLAGPLALEDYGSPSHVWYRTRFRLGSTDQPDIRSLICQINQPIPSSPAARHLTLAEIRNVVGEVITVVVAEDG